jgi:hypothetical protein
MGKVRGLGVRGLGERQYKEGLMTKYKIVSFLDVSPFTYEQLRSVSSIQRNVLRKNLDLLIEEETVLVHKYSIPYTKEFYGYMYKYPVPYMTPLYGHKYYLLDCSKLQCNGYMNYYYNNKGREEIELIREILIKERQKSRKKLCVHQDEIKSSKAVSASRLMEMSQNELRDYLQTSIENTICLERLLREREISAVRTGERFQYDDELLRMIKEESNKAPEVADFFIKKGYSMLDVLIRCSTEYTRINTTGYVADDLTLGLTRYGLLWKIMKKTGRLRI